ncbi:MAG: aspartate-semialdehyde dehydrogenase [Deltaproteobacteria bacterium]|nr:aspartate-semialdehyde dehydrogenase [Deltaproteobacteria bacterium]
MERLRNKDAYRVAIVGATGAVGRKLVTILEERSFPVLELLPYASRADGRTVAFGGGEIGIRPIQEGSFEGVDIAFFAAGGDVSRELVPAAARAGALVIDKSSVFRLEPDVPLVVPEVNGDDIEQASRGIIANPNCSTSQLVLAVAPLHERAGLTRLLVDTYQAVSGAGLGGIMELEQGTRAVLDRRDPPEPHTFVRPIAFNAVAQIDSFHPDGFTGEELKVMNETRKILHLPDLRVSCTAVRVPVFVGHCEAVNMQFERPIGPDEAREILASTPGVVVMDDPSACVFPTPLDAADRDDVLVGRIRTDPSCTNGLHLWCVSDNLRKGAATNAVQIAEHACRI